MPAIDTYSYFSGISAAIYFLICLLCGLQLSFEFPIQRQAGNKLLSHLVGAILLGWSGSAMCYILSASIQSLAWMYLLGSTIDLVLFVGVALAGYVASTNNQPSVRMLPALALPFVAIVLVFCLVPSFRERAIDLALIVLIIYYLCYGVVLLRREKLLADIYSDRPLHSIKWICWIIALMIGWWVLRLSLLHFGLVKLYDMTIFSYMSGFVLFVSCKISNYGEPIGIETQKEIEQALSGNVSIAVSASKKLQSALTVLLEEQKVYLCPDLKVDDIVRKLGTNTKYLSAMLHNDMHTSFCELINTYRIEESKKLMKSSDEKIARIAQMCGYNSVDTFCRNFLRITGKTPTDWRNQ